MKVKQFIRWQPGQKFFYKNHPAEVKWTDTTEFIIQKAHKEGEGDVYWRAASIYFEVEGYYQGITISSHFPDSEVDWEDFTV